MWTCANCNEESEEQFEACWRCQAPRPGTTRAEATPRPLQFTRRAHEQALNGTGVTLNGFDIPLGDLIVFCFKVLLALNIAAIPFYLLVALFIASIY